MLLGVGDWADTNIPTMEARPIAEMTTNLILGDFIIHAGLTENRLIGKRKRAAAEHFSRTEATEDRSRLANVVACGDSTGVLTMKMAMRP